jgi:hypothetical protein
VPRKLTSIDAREVSLVDRAANRRKFALVKFDAPGGGGMPDGVKISDDQLEALEDLFPEPAPNEDALLKAAGLEKVPDDDKKKRMARMLLRVAGESDLLDDKTKKRLAAEAGYGHPAPKKAARNGDEEEDDDEDEDMRKKGRGKKVAKAAADPDVPADLVPIVKAEPDLRGEIVTLLKAAEGDDATANVARASLAFHRRQAERLLKAEARAETERAERLREKALAKAAAFPHVPASQAELAGIMRHLEDADVAVEVVRKAADGKETKERVPLSAAFERLLKSAEAALAESDLLKSRGSDTPAAGSALAKINAMAEALVQKAGDKRPTKEAAWAQVVKDHPDLYEQYRREAGATGGRA